MGKEGGGATIFVAHDTVYTRMTHGCHACARTRTRTSTQSQAGVAGIALLS